MDTGAESSLISRSVFMRLGRKLPKLTNEQVSIKSAGGDPLISLGTVALWLKLGGREFSVKFHVVDNLLTMAILGSQDLANMGAILDCNKHTITFGDNVVKTHTEKTTSVYVTKKYCLAPGEHCFVKCKPSKKLNFKGSHLANPADSFSDILLMSGDTTNLNYACLMLLVGI